MKYFISAILVILTFSCTSTDKDSTTSFGGEIINPKTSFVLFLKDNKVIDTLSLDKNNRFFNKYKLLNEGLYTFIHGNEFQYIYLEPADSILIRLNTWDFDKSLVYSGKGSAKNEFLINLFLQNGKEEKEMYQYFSLSEANFQKKIDSLLNNRLKIYNDFSTTQTQISEGFKKLTSTAINYPLYRLKEMYPYYYKRAHKLDKSPLISENFYNFRSEISLDEEDLVSFYPYQNYVVSYLYNLSYKLKENDTSKNNITVNILNSAIQHIKLKDFKNTLLKKIIINDFFKSKSTCSINNKALDIFLKNCSNPLYITQVKNLVDDSRFVLNNEPLHNFEIVSYNNTNSTINAITKGKNSVIYFWSTAFMSPEYLVSRIKYLENKFPNILFVGINMQTSTEDLTKDPNLKLLDISKQFKLTENSYALNYLTSNYPRTIIVNKEGLVKNGFTYLDSRKLNSELRKLK
ncbi:TlpA family protein disulfide reductase [Lutibacter sp.]